MRQFLNLLFWQKKPQLKLEVGLGVIAAASAFLLKSWAIRSRNNHQHAIRGYQATEQYVLCSKTTTLLSFLPRTHVHHTQTLLAADARGDDEPWFEKLNVNVPVFIRI